MDQYSGTNFQIDLIQSSITWSDLAIDDNLKSQLNKLKSWLKNGMQHNTNDGDDDRSKKSFCALFSGSSESGKTIAAGLLAKEAGTEAYKIDLRMTVSKYIGETEKNLKTLFTQAEDKQWILFFDEADALFGKRTEVKDGHDRYSNVEVSYLLQLVENYKGMIILGANNKDCFDDVFLKRFDASLEF